MVVFQQMVLGRLQRCGAGGLGRTGGGGGAQRLARGCRVAS